MCTYQAELQRHSPPPEPDLSTQEAAQVFDQCNEEMNQLQALLGLMYDARENIPDRFRIGLSSDIHRAEQELASAQASCIRARLHLITAGYDV